MRFCQTVTAVVTGDRTYSAIQRAQILLNNVQPIGRIRGGTTYLESVLLPLDLVFTESAAGEKVVEEEKVYDAIQKIRLYGTGGGDPIFDLSGSELRAFMHFVRGERPHGNGDVTCAASSDTSAYLKITLPIAFVGSVSPEDAQLSLELLRDHILEITWASADAGGVFGAGLALKGTSAIRTAVLELVERDEFRVAPRMQLVSQEVGTEQQPLMIQGRILHAMCEVPVHADGIAANTISNAERTTYRLRGSSYDLIDTIVAADQIELWNVRRALTRSERLSDHDSTAAPFVPIYFRGRGYSATHLPKFGASPELKVSGTDTSPRVVHLSCKPVTMADVAQAIRMARPGQVPRGLTSRNLQRYVYRLTASGRLSPWVDGQPATALPVVIGRRPHSGR